MTNEQAIDILRKLPDSILAMTLPFDLDFDYKGAINMAIHALNIQESLERKTEYLMKQEESGLMYLKANIALYEQKVEFYDRQGQDVTARDMRYVVDVLREAQTYLRGDKYNGNG